MKITKVILTIGLLTVSLPAQDDTWSSRLEQFRLNRPTDARDYLLGPGDLVQISVFGVDSFNHELRVSASGKISLPYLGKIPVAGMTGEQVEDRLTELIENQALIKNPQVSLFIKEYRSQPVYVLGAVNQPGQYMMTQQLTLIDLITMAGGLDLQRADRYALVQRTAVDRAASDGPPASEAAQSPGPDAIKVDLKELLEEGNLALNLPIYGGDVIQVPERQAELFYVVGDVGRAGAFEFPSGDDKPLLLTQALVWAGGPGRTAKMSKGILVRYDAEGERQEIAVNFKAILKGREPDFPVQPNDIIFIPGSAAKTLGYGLLGVIPGTVQGSVIWRMPR